MNKYLITKLQVQDFTPVFCLYKDTKRDAVQAALELLASLEDDTECPKTPQLQVQVYEVPFVVPILKNEPIIYLYSTFGTRYYKNPGSPMLHDLESLDLDRFDNGVQTDNEK